LKCNIGDIEIFYESHGTGRPIVMLPGQPSDHRVQERLMEPIFSQREGWLRLYPDLPGTGQTPGLERLGTPDQILDAMLKFIDALIPGQRFVLAGLSYGGYLARGVVHRRADLIDGLLLCVPMVKGDESQANLPPRTPIVEDPALVADLGPVANLMVVQTPPMVEAAQVLLTELQKADFAFLNRLDSVPFSFDVDRLPTPFKAPTLILTGRQDNVCGYQDAWDLLNNFPRATFAVLDRAGHFIDVEQDALCHALIKEWLDRVEEAR
jgi:pimeloyl-ACP methyl ester carboxylesterase